MWSAKTYRCTLERWKNLERRVPAVGWRRPRVTCPVVLNREVLNDGSSARTNPKEAVCVCVLIDVESPHYFPLECSFVFPSLSTLDREFVFSSFIPPFWKTPNHRVLRSSPMIVITGDWRRALHRMKTNTRRRDYPRGLDAHPEEHHFFQSRVKTQETI